jgi:hypothetical protein
VGNVAVTLPIILGFSWSASRAATAWPGSAFASTPLPTHGRPSPACGQALSRFCDSAEGRHEHRHDADLRRAAHHALHPAVHPGDYAGPCFIGFAIGESLGAAALRIAGGIFTKIADIGSDLMKIVFKIKEDDARNPGVIADCTGDNAGDSVGPSADGFETYGVTGVALITFILLASRAPRRRCNCWSGSSSCAWPCCSSAGAYFLNGFIAKVKYGELRRDGLRGAADLAGLDHLHRFHRPDLRRLLPDDPHLGGDGRSGGSWLRSSPAEPWLARSSPNWSRSSLPPNRATCRKW